MLHLDLQERVFIATVRQTARWGRAIGLSTSTDFEHFTEPEPIVEPDDLDQEKGRETNRSAAGRCHRKWHRLGDRELFIGPSRLGSGAYDLTQLGPTAPILRTADESFAGEDELWFYYNGTKYRGGWKYVGTYPDGEHIPLPGLEPDSGAICLAVLRRDGFVSLDAGSDEGSVLTEPFVAPEGDLHLNADALEGSVSVQVCNEDGSVVPGFEASRKIEGGLPRRYSRLAWWTATDAGGSAPMPAHHAASGTTLLLLVRMRGRVLLFYQKHYKDFWQT